MSKKIKHCLPNSKGKNTGSDSQVKLNSFGWMMKISAMRIGDKESQIFVMTSTAFKSIKMVNGRMEIADKNSISHASMIPPRLQCLVEQCLIGPHLMMESIQFIRQK